MFFEESMPVSVSRDAQQLSQKERGPEAKIMCVSKDKYGVRSLAVYVSSDPPLNHPDPFT